MKFNALYKHQKTLFDALRIEEKRKYIQLHILSLLNIILELVGLGILFLLLVLILESGTYENLALEFPVLSRMDPIRFVFVLAGLFIVKNLLQLGLNYVQLRGVFSITSKLSDRIYGETFNADLSMHKRVVSGERINEITSITNSLPNQIIIPALTATTEFLFVAVAFVVLLYSYPLLLFWLCIFLLPPVILLLLLGKKRLDKYGVSMRDAMPKLYSSVTNVIFGFSEIKLFNLSQKLTTNFSQIKSDIYDKRIRSLMLSAMAPQRLMEVIAILGICILASFAVETHDSSSSRITLALFITAAFRLLPSLNRIVSSVNTLNTFANILDFLPSGNIVELVKDKNELGSFDSLKINELSFSFDDSKPVIDQVDFSLNRQEFIGISGESGTGKTTLINILMGFYFVPDEAVKINNYPLQHVLQQWQSKIGLVKQDPFMLSGSIEDNITFGLEKEEERLKQVIEQTQLADWVKSLEDGLETNVGELGTMVSGGQRQRIALARCLYRDSEVLIFDEATNALDAENKSAILDLINDLNVNGKTVLMVSHDEEVLARCHRTLRLR